MLLEDLMIKKEEIPILHENCFQVPIHPRLLNPNIKIDENHARAVFPKAAKEWYNELTEYSKTLGNKSTKEWIEEVFLKKKPKIKKEYDQQIIYSLDWKDEVSTNERGFARFLMINRNNGGSLYFNQSDTLGSRAFLPFNNSAGYIRFSKNKCLEFDIENKAVTIGDEEGVMVYVYNMHNVDHYPGALFLRNWAILYLNEAMKQVLKTP